ncbi:MAG: N-acetyltransferase [Verrucomicrobia bacterium]|nr:MAG: N-acetyltransferase [Verrucomicrobiota bacterium]
MNPPGILLETARMFLRELCADDADLIFQLDSDPEVMRFISQGVPTPRETFLQVYLPRMLSWQGQRPPRGFWAAHLRAGGEFIGWFHLRPDKITPEEMELGYRLARSAWGRGLATEGARALIEKAFREWGYEKISARTLAVNLASQRVMQKAGLKFEHEFTYGPEVIPGATESERRAVKYSLARRGFANQTVSTLE